MTSSQFSTSAALFLLPVLIGLVRRPFDRPYQRVASSLVIAVSMFALTAAWGYDFIAAKSVNEGIGAALVTLPVMILIVLMRGWPLISIKQDLSPGVYARLEGCGWLASVVFSLITVASMNGIHQRIH